MEHLNGHAHAPLLPAAYAAPQITANERVGTAAQPQLQNQLFHRAQGALRRAGHAQRSGELHHATRTQHSGSAHTTAAGVGT